MANVAPHSSSAMPYPRTSDGYTRESIRYGELVLGGDDSQEVRDENECDPDDPHISLGSFSVQSGPQRTDSTLYRQFFRKIKDERIRNMLIERHIGNGRQSQFQIASDCLDHLSAAHSFTGNGIQSASPAIAPEIH